MSKLWLCFALVFIASPSAYGKNLSELSLSEASSRLAKFGSASYVIISDWDRARAVCDRGLWGWSFWWNCPTDLSGKIFSRSAFYTLTEPKSNLSKKDVKRGLLFLANRYLDETAFEILHERFQSPVRLVLELPERRISPEELSRCSAKENLDKVLRCLNSNEFPSIPHPDF